MHHFQELDFPANRPGTAWLARCDIRVRLIVAVAVIVAVVMSTNRVLGLVAMGCSWTALIALGKPARVLLHSLATPLALAALVLLTQTFMTGAAPMTTIDLGFWRLTATREGFGAGTLIACRILGSFGIAMIACQGAAAAELLAALRWAKAPQTWIEIAVLMYRYLHVFLEQAVCVASAKRVRLGYSGLRRSYRSLGNLSGMVILRSLDQAEKSHEAMTARGYQGRLPLPAMPPSPGPRRPLPALEWRLLSRHTSLRKGGPYESRHRSDGHRSTKHFVCLPRFPPGAGGPFLPRWRERSWRSWAPTVRVRQPF